MASVMYVDVLNQHGTEHGTREEQRRLKLKIKGKRVTSR